MATDVVQEMEKGVENQNGATNGLVDLVRQLSADRSAFWKHFRSDISRFHSEVVKRAGEELSVAQAASFSDVSARFPH